MMSGAASTSLSLQEDRTDHTRSTRDSDRVGSPRASGEGVSEGSDGMQMLWGKPGCEVCSLEPAGEESPGMSVSPSRPSPTLQPPPIWEGGCPSPPPWHAARPLCPTAPGPTCPIALPFACGLLLGQTRQPRR